MSTILIIEDNFCIAEPLALRIGMRLKDSTILTARNGREGTALMDSRPVDLVITDLQMPVADGYTVIDHRNRRHPHVPLVVMTADGSRQVKERLRTLGVHQYVEKPFDFDTVAGSLIKDLRNGQGAASPIR